MMKNYAKRFRPEAFLEIKSMVEERLMRSISDRVFCIEILGIDQQALVNYRNHESAPQFNTLIKLIERTYSYYKNFYEGNPLDIWIEGGIDYE